MTINVCSVPILPPRNVGQKFVPVAPIFLCDVEQRVDDPLLPEHRVRVRQVDVHADQPRALLHQVGVVLLSNLKFPAA